MAPTQTVCAIGGRQIFTSTWIRRFTTSILLSSIFLISGFWASNSFAELGNLRFEASNESYRFELINNPNPDQSIRVSDIATKTGAELVINGGFYNPDFTPTGFLKINQKVISKVNSRGFSGYIAITDTGELNIFFRQMPPETYPTIFQSGPFLVDPGGKHGIRSPDERKAHRSAIIRHTSGKFTFILVRNSTLFDLATNILNTYSDVDYALNLDGGPVAGFWDKKDTAKRHLNISPSRNYLTLHLKKSEDLK